MKNVKRLLSFLLTAAMLLSLLPTFALASETEQLQWTEVSTAEQLTSIMTDGGNAKLTADVTIAALTVTTAVNVDFNGCTLTATGKITIKAGGNVTFSGDGTFTTSVDMCLYLSGGDLTINGGTFTDTAKIAYVGNTGSHMYVNGGTINATYIQVNYGVLEIRNATVNATVFQPKVGSGGSAASIVRIYSGTVSSVDYRHLSSGAGLYIHGGTIGNLVLNKNATTKPAQIHGGTFNGTLSIKAGNLIVDGGKFKNELGAAHIADGYFSFKGGDGYYTVYKEPDVATDGNTVTVATDAEFMWAVQSGYNIVLGQDITIDTYDTIKFTKPVTLELGDFTLTINDHHGGNILSAQYAEASETGMIINAGTGGIVVNSYVLAAENTKAFFRVNTMTSGETLCPNKLTINGGTYTWNNASEQEDTDVFSTRVMFNLYTSHPTAGEALVNGATLISDFGVLYNANKSEDPVFTDTSFLDTSMKVAIDANDAVEHLWKYGDQSFYGVAVYPGKAPMYRGDKPTKEADAEYTYTFKNWVASADEAGNVTYAPEFDAVTNTYTITWIIGDETIEETYAYGTMPQAPAISKAPDAENHYAAAWDSEIVAVTGNATYTAIFTAEPHAEGEKADHKCDTCGVTLSECADEDKNHKCDICGAAMGEHADGDDNDHLCDYCQGAVEGEEHSYDNACDATCNECGESREVGDHAWGDWIVDEEKEGCTKDGSKHRTCITCGETETETIPAEHRYESGHCVYCGVIDPSAEVVAKIGETEYAQLDVAMYYAKAGDTVVLVKDAVIEKDVTLKSGVTYEIPYGLTLTIAKGGRVIAVADSTLNCSGTIVVKGIADISVLVYGEGGTFGACGGKLSVKEGGYVNMLKSWEGIWNPAIDDQFGHMLVDCEAGAQINVGKQNWCNASGIWYHTNHEYTSVVTPPTCTEQGYTTHTCDVCGKSYVNNYEQEIGHANGDADHICDICGETLSTCDDCWVADRVIPATFESNAIQVYVCAICGAEKEEEIPNTKLVAVAVIGDKKFETLAEAVAAAENGDVIELQMSVAGSGIVINKSITINLNGYTYTVGDPTVGSAGTETLGFQILKNNEVSIVNGTIKAGTDACKMLIQNYADLLLFGVTLDGTDSANMQYVLSNNCGYTSIEQSAIIAPEGAVAFDVYDYTAGGYTLPKVTVVMSDVEGIVEVDENVTLHIQGGDFTKATFDVASAESIDIYQGTFASAVPEEWCADGVIPAVDAEGNFTVKNGAYVARNVTTGVGYETLAEAIAEANENDTIKLLSSVSGSGIVINESVTIDFGGFTYTFVAPAVGSTGTESNGFQILTGNTVTLKNGSLNVAEEAADQFYMLIQNYANLTITDMDLDGTNLDKWALTDGDSYVVSNNCGTVNINGETNITANNDGDLAFAFDVCKYGSYAAPTVNVNTTGTIQGKIEVSAEINTNLNISGGTFTQAIQEDWCAEGYVPVNGGVAEGTKVTWFNEDGTVIYSKYVLKGETAEYTGETPTKAEDETYTYTFDKWIAVEGGFQATFTAEEKKFELYGANVTLGNNLDMKFAFAIDKVSDWTGHYVKIVKENADGTTREQTYYYDEGQWQKDGNYYVVVFTGIAAKEMSDELTVTVYNAAGEAVSEPWVDSMRAYAMRQLNSDKNAENALLKTAIVDMLNYGAAAQNYFDYDEGNLANALLTDAQKAYATESTELTLNGYAKPQEYYYGSNLTLKSNIVFQIGFENLADDMTVEVAYTNHSGDVVTASYQVKDLTLNAGIRVVVLDMLVVSDARQVITITVKNAAGGTVFEMQESIEEYMARRDKTDIEESFMKFSDSAHAYLHRNDE